MSLCRDCFLYYMNRNLISITLGLMSSIDLLLIHLFPGRLVFGLVSILWLAALGFAAWFIERLHRQEQWVLWILLTTSAAFLGLMILIEWPILRLFMIGLGGIAVMLLFRSIMTAHETPLHIQQKPYRRIIMLLWVFDAYALGTTIFAVGLFFPGWPFWLLALVSALVYGYIAFMIWRMYYLLSLREHWLWVWLMIFLIFELVWVAHLLPVGYLVAGFLVTWLWYLLQLLTRFHFGPSGVLWQKQKWFLVGNAALYVLTLVFFVRWV